MFFCAQNRKNSKTTSYFCHSLWLPAAGQDVAIAVFKNDDSFSISLSFKQKTEA
jgi:hypothetical protein